MGNTVELKADSSGEAQTRLDETSGPINCFGNTRQLGARRDCCMSALDAAGGPLISARRRYLHSWPGYEKTLLVELVLVFSLGLCRRMQTPAGPKHHVVFQMSESIREQETADGAAGKF